MVNSIAKVAPIATVEVSNGEWAVIIFVGVSALVTCILSILQGRHIKASALAHGEHDLSHGQQIRRWFMYMIAIASGVRFMCNLTLGISVYLDGLFNETPGMSTLNFLTLFPSLFYFTLYSLLTVYFAQLYYTVLGQAFFHVRNVSLGANVGFYALFLVELLFFRNASVVYAASALAFAVNLVMTAWFGCGLFKHFPAGPSPSGGDKLSNSNAANSEIEEVKARLLPLVVTCMAGLGLGLLWFLLLLMNAVHSVDVTTNGVCVLISELCPSWAFLLLVGQRDAHSDDVSGARSGSRLGYSAIDDGYLANEDVDDVAMSSGGRGGGGGGGGASFTRRL
jgi:hypothetical protein